MRQNDVQRGTASAALSGPGTCSKHVTIRWPQHPRIECSPQSIFRKMLTSIFRSAARQHTLHSRFSTMSAMTGKALTATTYDYSPHFTSRSACAGHAFVPILSRFVLPCFPIARSSHCPLLCRPSPIAHHISCSILPTHNLQSSPAMPPRTRSSSRVTARRSPRATPPRSTLLAS